MQSTQSLGTWRDWISSTYFDLDVQAGPSAFRGELARWETGAFGVSTVRTAPILYRRRKESCAGGVARFLVTLPTEGAIRFSQFGREAICDAGDFVIESGDEPYELAQARPASLMVFRADENALRDRVRDVRRFSASRIDARQGAGRLFADFLRLSVPHIAQDPDRLLPRLGPQLLDLLALALEDQPHALHSGLSAVKSAHLARVDRYIERHLADPSLSLEAVAGACGISLRYLHRLFQSAETTGQGWIRDRRLRRAQEMLRSGSGRSIAEIAYGVGFNDQAHFARSYRAKFGCSPSEDRARMR
jgi:AraC-like DNA-binding protein